MEKEKSKNNPFTYKILIATIFFNWIFPKAGIKMHGIPVTIGIVLFTLLIIIWLFIALKKRKTNFSKIEVYILIGQFFFTIRFILAYWKNIGFSELAGYITPLVIFPCIYFACYDLVDSTDKYDRVLKILTYGFFIVSIYAFFQQIFGIAKIDIPGLTVNLTDYRTMGENWFLHKSNGIDISSSKIVSTYQNGNLFGENMLIGFPIIYDYLITRRKKKLALISLITLTIIIMLTLSRTCYIGLILFYLFRIILTKENSKSIIVKRLLILTISVLGVYLTIRYIPAVSNRILNVDKSTFLNGSGRTSGGIEFLKSVFEDGNLITNLFIGAYGFIENKGLAYEMTQLSIFKLGGLIGLIIWCIPFYYYCKNKKKDNIVENSFRISIICWFLFGIIEGGYWLPPTVLNLFMIMALGDSYKRIKRKENDE